MEPLVSILIPAYNAELWLGDAIQSALGQNWCRKEIIVVDDGSKDQTLSVAKRFASSKVHVITQVNAGAPAARNRALTVCQGDFIQWLDADDLLASDKIENQMAVYEKLGNKRFLLSAAWGSFICRPRRARFRPSALWCDLPPLEWLLLQMEQNLHMQTATWLVSRELTAAAGPWDMRLASCASDDGEYFCRVILSSEGIRFVPDSKVYYRQPISGNQSCIGISDKKLKGQLFGLTLYISHLLARQDNERVRTACISFLQFWFHNFYPNCSDLVEQAQHLAKSLGGKLHPPDLSWKYAWIQKLFGWNAAKLSQLRYNRCKTAALFAWDKAMLSLEGGSGAK